MATNVGVVPLDEVDLLLLKGAADTATIAGAARTVGMTQAVAVRRLRRLERRLELTLINGDAERVGITPAGRALLAAGWTFVGAVAAAAQRVSDAVAGRPTGIPRLRLAGFGRNWDGFADDLAAHLPGVLLDVSTREPAEAVELYDRYAVDAVYAWLLPGDELAPSRAATVLTVLDEPLWIALPASHPSARSSDPVPLRSLSVDRWITGSSERARRLVHAVCLAEGFAPRLGYTADSPATARSMISHAVGVALVSPLTVPPVNGAGIAMRPLRAAPRRRHVLAFDTAVVDERLAGILVQRLRASYLSTARQRNPIYLRDPDFPVPAAAPDREIEFDTSLLARLRPDAGDPRRLGLDDLHLLRAVCEAGSVNRAARELMISQPALSRRIRRLERNLGVTLFVRSYRGTEPTPAAHDLLEEVAEGQAAFRAALRSIRRS